MLQEPTLVRVIVQIRAVHGSRILLPGWWQWRVLERLETLLVVVTPEKKKIEKVTVTMISNGISVNSLRFLFFEGCYIN
jgi:hypothetical protein